jgi:CBS domain-containing protein
LRTAADVMRQHVIVLSPGDTIGEAGAMMGLGRIRQLPVVEGLRLVGELSFRDLLAAYQELFGRAASRSARARQRVWGALERRPIEGLVRPAEDLVWPETPLAQVARRIVRRGAGFVPVVEEDAARAGPRLLGIVTERDLLHHAIVHAKPGAPPHPSKTG